MLRPAPLSHVLWFDLLSLILVLQLTNRSSATRAKEAEGIFFNCFLSKKKQLILVASL